MKLLNVPKGHKKSETFFRVSEKLPREGFRSEASKPFRKSKAFSKSLQKSKTFEKGLEKDILSKTTSHTRKNCVAIFCVSEMQRISERLVECCYGLLHQVVFEHAQKFSRSKKMAFQPPVRNWWKISDILKKIILLSLFLVSMMLLVSSCKPEDKLAAGNTSIPGFYKVIMISIPEDYNDVNNLKEIHIANVTVNNNGEFGLVVIKDNPSIEELETAIKKIESEEGLFLEYEDKEGDKLVLKKELVKPGDPRYIYAVTDELAAKYGFKTDMRCIYEDKCNIFGYSPDIH